MPSPLLGASGKGSGNKKMPRFVWSLKHRELLRTVLVSVKSVLDKSLRYVQWSSIHTNNHTYCTIFYTYFIVYIIIVFYH